MRRDQREVGFSQRVRLEWLEQTASYVLAGMTEGEVTQSLRDLLLDKVSVGGNARRGNREKTITILRRIWLPANDGHEGLRQRALEFLRARPKDEHLVFHWGMAMAVYPFWGSVADAVGRLLAIQGTVTAGQAQRRIRERYGERETVARATRRIIRCFVDWHVLKKAINSGSYAQIASVVVDTEAAAWLIEALLHGSSARRVLLAVAMNSPGLFPFSVPSLSCEQLVRSASGLEAIHRGFDSDVISLRE